jgi:NAD-dependent SIR2 family protein deacetylase
MSSRLTEFFRRHRQVFVLTGAGISTASGIPDYRDEQGRWKHRKPMEYRDFVEHHHSRQRYWARSFIGWQRFRRARPNLAHQALARLEALGRLAHTVTQNVDGLHQSAGSRRLTELHGSLAEVACLACGSAIPRESMQRRLLDANPLLAQLSARAAPDGDALLEAFDESDVFVPSCKNCGGILKPGVVFFGESVPAGRVDECYDALRKADAMLVVGSSLMVFSGFRFVREAARLGMPVAALNRGRTRADESLAFKLETDCADALAAVVGNFDAGDA